MSDIHIVNINTVCRECGYRNKGQYKITEDMNVICCGNCGKVMIAPDEMTEDDKKILEACVEQALDDLGEDY